MKNDQLIDRALKAYGAAYRILDPIRFRIYGETGVTVPQLRVLFLIREHGELRPTMIADLLDVTPSTITGITDRLVKQGFLDRQQDTRDRRAIALTLSERGKRLTSDVSAASRNYLKDVLSRLDEQRILDLVQSLDDMVMASAELDKAKVPTQTVRP